MIKSISQKFHSSINNLQTIIANNKGKLWRFFAGLLVFLIIFLNSGYTFTYLLPDTFYQSLVLFISFLVIGFIFVATYDFSKPKEMLKNKRPTWMLIVLSAFAISAFITIFVSGETGSLMMYFSFGIRILCAFLIAKLLSFEKFIKYYQISIFIITLIAIFVFLYTLVSGINFSVLPEFVSGRSTVFYNYFFLTFQFSQNRMQGIFWEPGMLATFLLLALSFEILFRRKIRPLFVVVFITGLLLTFSTFGYVCLVIVLIIFVNKKVRNIWVAAILYVLLFGGTACAFIFANQIIPVLAEIFPTVFEKLVKKDVVVLLSGDRVNSLLFDLEYWLKKPIFGNGMSAMTNYYAGEAIERNIHAQTSTLTYFLAEFGILGLAFPFFLIAGLFSMKRIAIEDKVALLILYLLILFKEPHQGIMFDYIFIFLIVKEGLDHDYKSLVFDEYYDNCIIKSFFKKDNDSIIKRNIFASFAIKGLSLVLGFFSYPLYMRYFDNENVLGVWLTILSIVSMIIMFDFGFGNGLRNKLIKPLIDNDVKKQNQLITSTYFSTMIMSIVVFGILLTLILSFDMNSLLGISSAIISPSVLKISLIIVCASICLEFSLKNITVILQALQKQALANTFALLSTVSLMLFSLIAVIDNPESKLLAISIFYAVVINIPLIIGTIIVIKRLFPKYKAKISDLSRSSIKEVALLGIGFFLIQLMLLVINSTNELLISNFYGSNVTVVYTDYNKLIQIIISLFATITLPYWSMVTKLKEQHDTSGIYKLMRKLMIFVVIFAGILALVGIFFQPLLDIWLGDRSIAIDTKTLIFFMIFAILWILILSFSSIANGLSIIKQQIVLYAIAAITKISFSLIFGIALRGQFGWEYIVLSNVFACLVLVVGLPILCILELRKLKEVKYV